MRNSILNRQFWKMLFITYAISSDLMWLNRQKNRNNMNENERKKEPFLSYVYLIRTFFFYFSAPNFLVSISIENVIKYKSTLLFESIFLLISLHLTMNFFLYVENICHHVVNCLKIIQLKMLNMKKTGELKKEYMLLGSFTFKWNQILYEMCNMYEHVLLNGNFQLHTLNQNENGEMCNLSVECRMVYTESDMQTTESIQLANQI